MNVVIKKETILPDTYTDEDFALFLEVDVSVYYNGESIGSGRYT